MKREFSAGGIVFNKAGQVLLTKSSGKGYWQFPKGRIESGQTSKEAAVREVKEEGGVEAEIIEKVADSKYVYPDPQIKEMIFKVVTFYLMEYLSGDPQNHHWEVEEAGWYESEEALKKLSFSDQKKFLKQALEMRQR